MRPHCRHAPPRKGAQFDGFLLLGVFFPRVDVRLGSIFLSWKLRAMN